MEAGIQGAEGVPQARRWCPDHRSGSGELEELPDRGQLSAQAQEFFKKN
jgi:hypothetical protein